MKKKSILLSILIVAILIVCFYVSNYQENHIIFRSGRIAKPSSMFALMFETGENTGIYEEQTDTEWPYYREYVAELSGCENGSTLTWNDTTKTISVTGNISDKCYLYFGPILETAPRSTYVVPTCDGSSCGLVESVNVLTSDENDTYTIYTVGYIEDDSTTSVTYSIDITNLDIDLSEYKLVVDGTPQVMTTYQDFENYYIMKTKGEPETSLSNVSTLKANYTVNDLYTYALGTNELTIDSVTMSCNGTKCTATINESFSGLSNKAKHSTTTSGENPISVVYNGIKINLKKEIDYTCHDCKYWNDNYSDTEYAGTVMPTGTGLNGVYDSRELLASAYSNFVNSPTYIRTSIENGTPTGHEACYYRLENDREFCFGPNYWETDALNTKVKLKADMEEKLGITLYNSYEEAESVGHSDYYCDSDASSAYCFVGDIDCDAGSDGYVNCYANVAGGLCSVLGDGTAYCH